MVGRLWQIGRAFQKMPATAWPRSSLGTKKLEYRRIFAVQPLTRPGGLVLGAAFASSGKLALTGLAALSLCAVWQVVSFAFGELAV